MDKPPWFVTLFICFSCHREGRDTDGYSAGYRVAERSQIILRREKCCCFFIYLFYQSVMLPFISNLMNMLISTFLNLSGYLNLFIQAVYCSYCDLWVWVEFVIKWMVGCLPPMCLFKGKLEVTRCHTDTGHMHAGLKRISVYSHYSVTLRIAVLTWGCEPPTTT